LSLISSDYRNAYTSYIGVDALLSETSLAVLTRVLGKKTATLLAWRFKIVQTRQDEAVSLSSADAFSHALHRVFGSGADAIELLILRDMYSRSGATFSPVSGYSFEDYVYALLPHDDHFLDNGNAHFLERRNPAKKRARYVVHSP
jgi:hypothetical protein